MGLNNWTKGTLSLLLKPLKIYIANNNWTITSSNQSILKSIATNKCWINISSQHIKYTIACQMELNGY
jgi:hypothetical protein